MHIIILIQSLRMFLVVRLTCTKEAFLLYPVSGYKMSSVKRDLDLNTMYSLTTIHSVVLILFTPRRPTNADRMLNSTTLRTLAPCANLRIASSLDATLSFNQHRDEKASENLSIVFGVLGVVMAAMALALAALQLRHMHRQRQSKSTCELA